MSTVKFGKCFAEFMISKTLACRLEFPLPLVLGMGCVILLWHSLSILYNHFVTTTLLNIDNPYFEGTVNQVYFN